MPAGWHRLEASCELDNLPMKLSSTEAARRACVRAWWLAACVTLGMAGSSTASAVEATTAVVASASPASQPKKATRPKAAKPQSPSKHGKSTVRSDSDPDQVIYGQRADVMQFAAEVAQRQDLDVAWVRSALAQSRFMPAVAKLIMPPPTGTAKNWAAYRDRFIEPKRIAAGVAFWRANERWLTRAEEVYGVPAEIVIGIIGVETLYGQHMGGFRVIDALATLAFDFPPGRKDRSAFFKDELEQWLVLSHREGLDPLQPKGSYAGALGMPQFMPSSVTKYAVDFDGDGHIDLHTNTADVIGSVARYLADFGWQRGLITHLQVTPPADATQRAELLAPDILPSFTAQEFIDHGAVFGSQAELARIGGPAGSTRLALVELQNADAAPSHVAGTGNFYAVTRYNWSSYYALAVIELGAAVRRAR
jgi:membrane-bound lytic murein transglycosylase B